MRKFTLTVEGESDAGLWFITSDDAVDRAHLLVAQPTLQEALAEIPQAIKALEAAKLGGVAAPP